MARPCANEPTYKVILRGNRWHVQWWDGRRSVRISCRTADRDAAERFLARFRAKRGANIPPAIVTVAAVLADNTRRLVTTL